MASWSSCKHIGWIRLLTAVIVGCPLCGTIGCGSSEPFDMVPVSGNVTYDDGSLISAARIEVRFTPQVEPADVKTHARPGSAEVTVADGTFSVVSSREYGDGLAVGRHEVSVLCYDEDGTPTELEVMPSEIEVGPDSTEFEFRVIRP